MSNVGSLDDPCDAQKKGSLFSGSFSPGMAYDGNRSQHLSEHPKKKNNVEPRKISVLKMISQVALYTFISMAVFEDVGTNQT